MNRFNIFAITLSTLVFTTAVWAAPQEAAAPKAEVMEGQKATTSDAPNAMETVNIANKICPISGQPVEAMGAPVPVEYNGKMYNLCCKMCAKDFQADPEKFMKKAEEEMKAQNTSETPKK
jgi:YHS domain-containing protein